MFYYLFFSIYNKGDYMTSDYEQFTFPTDKHIIVRYVGSQSLTDKPRS